MHAELILTDDDVARLVSPREAVAAMEAALEADHTGDLDAPARFYAPAGEGQLVFTAGAETNRHHASGFRVYGRYPGDASPRTQLVAVFDARTGGFRGLILGRLIGGMRTAALNAVAVKLLARANVRRLGLLGTGFQAHHHVRAALLMRSFEQVDIFSPTRAHREAFARALATDWEGEVRAVDDVEEAVRGAEVLICATDQQNPIFDAAWVSPGTHVNGIGPKFKGGHEIPLELPGASGVIATDSLAQIEAMGADFYLEGTPHLERIVSLSSLSAGVTLGRTTSEQITYFCSVGLAGTEVVLADLALQMARMETA